MLVDKHFYIGQSNRTNIEGANQFLNIVKKYGYEGTIVPFDDGLLHLKTGMTYLSDNNLLITKRFMDYKEFEKFNRILIDSNEEYASNCIFINGKVIMPKGFENTKDKVLKLGYDIIEVPMTEYEKIDGGLTCLSLRY